MKKLFYTVLAIGALFVASCGNNSNEAASSETDTTQVVEQIEAEDVDEMVAFINDVSLCIDSIQRQEHYIFKSKEGITDKQKMLIQLSSFRKLLARKQTQIDELMKKNENLSRSSKKTIQNLQTMVQYLNTQLAEKTKKIEMLEELCQNKDISIDELRYNLAQLSGEAEYLKEQNYQQDKALNECFYIAASKSELKDKGLMTAGSLFSKGKVDNNNIDKELFKKVDSRSFKTLTLQSKSPKIITGNPEGSYTITKNDDGTSTLTINDPERFWKVSKFLIIQL